MIGFDALTLIIQLGGTVLLATEKDIPYFEANPGEMRQTLKECHQDFRKAASFECMNAEAAATRRMGKPLSLEEFNKVPLTEPDPPPAPLPPPIPPARGKERAA